MSSFENHLAASCQKCQQSWQNPFDGNYSSAAFFFSHGRHADIFSRRQNGIIETNDEMEGKSSMEHKSEFFGGGAPTQKLPSRHNISQLARQLISGEVSAVCRRRWDVTLSNKCHKDRSPPVETLHDERRERPKSKKNVPECKCWVRTELSH